MLKKYLKKGTLHTIVIAASSVVTRLISFIFLPYYLNYLSLEDFGIWDFYQTFYSYGLLLLSSAASISLSRFYLLHQDDSLRQKQAVGNACAMALITSLILLLLLLCGICGGFLSSYNNPYAFFTVINAVFFSLFSMLMVYARIRDWLIWYSVLVIVQNGIATVCTFWGVVNGCGVISFFWSTTISTIIFFPLFIILFKKYFSFSWDLAREQLAVSLPLVIYSFSYALFFSIDRILVQWGTGYELLGSYGLLWRFGAIFQFACIALMNSSTVILFSAQNEANGSFLVKKLLSYICILIISGALYVVIISRFIIHYWFPEKYYYLVLYLPAFFLPLVFLECGRFVQLSFTLANKTIWVPLISFITLGIQVVTLWYLIPYGLWGILGANSIAFLFYIISCYVGSQYVYPNGAASKRVISILILFSAFIAAFQAMFLYNVHWLNVLILSLLWPSMVWFVGGIELDEKQWFRNNILSIMQSKFSVFCYYSNRIKKYLMS